MADPSQTPLTTPSRLWYRLSPFFGSMSSRLLVTFLFVGMDSILLQQCFASRPQKGGRRYANSCLSQQEHSGALPPQTVRVAARLS